MTKKEKNAIAEALGFEHYAHHTDDNCKIYPPLILNFIFSGVMAVIMGIYYFANPDSHYRKGTIGYSIPVDLYCWSTNTVTFECETTPEYNADGELLACDTSNYDIVMSVLPPFDPERFTINVTDQVLVWFEFGFIIYSIALGGAMIALFMGPESKIAFKWGALVCGFMNIVVGLPWTLTGTILRWRLPGARCAGDLNYDS